MSALYQSTPISPDLATHLHAMPKIELHVHLEGATDARTVWEMAHRNDVRLPASTLEEWEAMYAFRDFNHFLKIYLAAANCMRTPEDFAFMTERFLAQQAAHNVRYTEAFLSASLFLDKFPLDELIDALIEGANRGKAQHGARIQFIPDIGRHVPDTQHGVLDFVMRGRDKGIFLGLGLGGPEVGFPPELFSDVYEEARRQNLHVVAHAGETMGPESIWGAIHTLKVERIGHGVRAVEDEALLEYLATSQIPLEVSPHSNYRLKVVPDEHPHPIRILFDAGVFTTVNSDDPPMFSTDITQEYVLLAKQGFTMDELWQLNCNAIEASFLSEQEKNAYRKEWDQWAK